MQPQVGDRAPAEGRRAESPFAAALRRVWSPFVASSRSTWAPLSEKSSRVRATTRAIWHDEPDWLTDSPRSDLPRSVLRNEVIIVFLFRSVPARFTRSSSSWPTSPPAAAYRRPRRPSTFRRRRAAHTST